MQPTVLGANFLGSIAGIAAGWGRRSAGSHLLESPQLVALGDSVLSAVSRADLADAIDEQTAYVDDTMESLRSANEAHANAGMTSETAGLDIPSLERVLGIAATNICKKGHRALVELLDSVSSALGASSPEPSAEASADENEGVLTLDSMIREQRLPIPVRRALLKVAHSLVAMLAIARAEQRGSRLEPWLALGLAEHFAAGFSDAAESVRKLLPMMAEPSQLQAVMQLHEDAMDRYEAYANYLREGGAPLMRVDDSGV